MCKDIFKKKYLLINDEQKILTFVAKLNGITKVFFPGTITCEKKDLLETQLYDKEDFIFFAETIRKELYFTSRNYKLIENERVITNQYYVGYKELDNNEIKNILDYAYELDIVPEFLSIEELENLIVDKPPEIMINPQLKEVLGTLEKKLTYQEY